MRNISPASLAKIAQQYGAEPVFVIGIVWNITETFYADKDMPDIPAPAKIISVNEIEDVTNLQGSGSSSNIQVVLDDADGTIKAIFDNLDVHRRPVNIYQFFEGIAPGEQFVIYEGLIESPISYNDGERTFSFNLVTMNEHTEAGFSPEEGQFPNLPTQDIGQAWPMAFGNANRTPGLTYQYPVVGIIQDPFYVVDPSLDVYDASQFQASPGSSEAVAIPKKNFGAPGEFVPYPAWQSVDAVEAASETNTEGILSGFNGGAASWVGTTTSNFVDENAAGLNGESIFPPGTNFFIINGKEYDAHDYDFQINITAPDNGHPLVHGVGQFNIIPTQNQSAYAQLPNIDSMLRAQGARTDGVQLINQGLGFPVGKQLYLTMNNHVFSGIMDKTGFMKLNLVPPPQPVPAYYDNTGLPAYGSTIPEQIPVISTQRIQNITFFAATGVYTPQEYAANPPHFDNFGQVNVGWKLQQGLVSDGFQLYQSGSQITILGDHSVDYIVNIFPTTVARVYGYKAVGNEKVLTTVPRNRWTQVQVQFPGVPGEENGVTATIVRLNRLLSAYPGEGWDDGIFVDQHSAVGPNPVDIIQYLILLYCPDLTYDPDSFDVARTALTNYPMNFVLADKPEILSFLQELAYEARCALYVKNRTFFIKYLPLLEDAADAITVNDVLEGSVVIESTETEQLITRYDATFTDDYSKGLTSHCIVRNNLQKYGLFKESHPFFYTNAQYVQKTATYWTLIRSNVWKRLKFSTPLTKLNLETFDIINFDIPGLVANSSVPCRIESTQYDSVANKIDFECWVPVLLGQMDMYPFAYPADAVEQYTPPYLRDFQANEFQDFRQYATGVLATTPGQQTNSTTGGGTDSFNASGQPITAADTSPYQSDTGSPILSDRGDKLATELGPLLPIIEGLVLPKYTPNKAPDQKINGQEKPVEITPLPSAGAIPGSVISQVNGEVYSVQIWPLGKNSTVTQNVIAIQLQIDPTDVIPPGTACLVSAVCTGKSGTPTNIVNNYEYYFQVPVWLPNPPTS